MNKNFGQMLASVDSWAREVIDPDVKSDALNDAIITVWSKVLQAQIDQVVGGPTTVQFAAGSERTQLVSIADPAIAPVVNPVAGGALAARNPVVAYSIVTESGSETMISPPTVAAPGQNQICQVVAPARVANAFGYNVYAGSTLALMSKQNDVPMDFGFPFTEPVTGFVDAGDENGAPLPPVENTTADDIFYIRALESPLSTGGYRRWEHSTIDSMMFRYASRSIAAASEYQPYYWDLVNGRQLEYRPVLAQAYTARYFFIHRPRRISFGRAAIPFTAFDVEEALRSYTISAWKLTQSEFMSADAWQKRGDRALMDLMTNLRQQDWDKNTTIIPYMGGS